MRGNPEAVVTFNMPKRKSRVLKVTTRSKYVHHFPRVTQVLNHAIDTGPSQASLAAETGVDRAVLNQLCRSKAAASPDLVGRLAAGLPTALVADLLKAYVDDMLSRVEKSRSMVTKRSADPVVFTVHYPSSGIQ